VRISFAHLHDGDKEIAEKLPEALKVAESHVYPPLASQARNEIYGAYVALAIAGKRKFRPLSFFWNNSELLYPVAEKINDEIYAALGIWPKYYADRTNVRAEMKSLLTDVFSGLAKLKPLLPRRLVDQSRDNAEFDETFVREWLHDGGVLLDDVLPKDAQSPQSIRLRLGKDVFRRTPSTATVLQFQPARK